VIAHNPSVFRSAREALLTILERWEREAGPLGAFFETDTTRDTWTRVLRCSRHAFGNRRLVLLMSPDGIVYRPDATGAPGDIIGQVWVLEQAQRRSS
jgi:hypothetical protein